MPLPRLSGLVATGRIRHWLKDLPVLDMARFLTNASDAQISLAMVRYAFLVQAHVWGEPAPPDALPANLAVPFVALADRIGVPPVMNYADYILENWYRLDRSGPIALGNVLQVQQFAGGLDEEWFVQIHVAIEATAGRALELAVELVRASDAGDAAAVEAMLIEMEAVWERIIAIFDRMVEKCDPYIYYNRIRLYINGWKNNAAMPAGLIYEGVEQFGGRPREFRGPTGSQSSIVPTMDALFQVSHENDELRDLLLELHHYRPRRHRAFIEDLQAASRLRDFAMRQGQRLKRRVQRLCRAGRPLPHPSPRICRRLYQQAGVIGLGNDPDIWHRRHALHEVSEEAPRRQPRANDLALGLKRTQIDRGDAGRAPCRRRHRIFEAGGAVEQDDALVLRRSSPRPAPRDRPRAWRRLRGKAAARPARAASSTAFSDRLDPRPRCAKPPLSRTARRIRKSPIALGTRMPAATVCGILPALGMFLARLEGADDRRAARRPGRRPCAGRFGPIQPSASSSSNAFHMPISPVPPPVG